MTGRQTSGNRLLEYSRLAEVLADMEEGPRCTIQWQRNHKKYLDAILQFYVGPPCPENGR